MLFQKSRLRAPSAAGGFLLLCVFSLPSSAQEELPAPPEAPVVSPSREEARRVIQQLPPPPVTAPSAIQTPNGMTAPVIEVEPAPEPIAVPRNAPPSNSLRAITTRLNLPLPLPQGRIVVSKSRRTLDLFNGDTLVKSYHVALGPNPGGHKQSQGDGRTPEGQFYICTRNAKDSAFHIFLGLSYPALPDASRAVNAKQITWREYQVIRQRLASRGAPLWRTRLGSWVGIHGGTGGKFAQKKTAERKKPDWTAGCVAVTDREIAEIHAATRMGTSVLIKP
jgi:hypothetical protein